MPRRRVISHLDFKTERLTHSEEYVPEDASIAQRFGELAEQAQKVAGDGHKVMWVVCDECGRRDTVERPELPPEWISNPEGEFCPTCTASRG